MHAYVPMSFAPGEAYQFDWSHETITLAGLPLTVKAAHMKLSHSRMPFVRVYFRETQELVFDAHDKAFRFYGGVCRRGIYDNMKTAVEAIFVGKVRRYNLRFLQMCSHHLIEPVACTPASGWEKGQVENQVGNLRDQMFRPKPRPTGKLRFGVAFAPKMSALFVVKDAGGTPRGVTADLGNELAQRLGVPIEFMVAPNTGVLTDALASAAIDVAFMPVDEERKKRLEFGPAYCLVESTYMVTAASGIRTLAEVDRPGVRVVGIANTTTIRAAGRSLINTVPIAVTSIDDAVAMLRAGQADAFALGRDSLPSFVAEFPGSHIVDGGFQQTGIAIAVPKGHPEALAYVTKFIEDAKASGSVRRAMERAGMANLAVAPPER